MPSTYSFTFDTPSNPWVVTHNLDDPSPFWVAYSSTGEVIFPESVVATDANTLTITFDSPIAGSGAVFSVLQFTATGATNAFTTVNAVKLFLGLDSTDTEQDLPIAVTISAVTETMKRFMDREILQQEILDELHDAEGGTTLFLQQYPVITTSGITVRSDDVVVSGTDYVVKADPGIVKLKSGSFSNEPCGVSVDYVGGFAEVPGDLNYACVKQVAYELRLRGDRDAISLARSKIDGVVEDVYLTGDWGQGVEDALSRYQRWSVL